MASTCCRNPGKATASSPASPAIFGTFGQMCRRDRAKKIELRIRQQMHQISDDDMQVGETWFVWGIFSAITDDRPRQQKLLADYLARKIQPRGDIAKIVRDTLALDSEGNQLFNAISTAGRQAYHEDGDHHLSKIAAIFLNAIKNH